MDATEVDAVRDALNLMGYVSAHALNEPIRRMADSLGRFVHAIVTADKPPELLSTHIEATIAFDNCLNQVPLFRDRILRNTTLFAGEAESGELHAAFQADYDRPSPWRALWESVTTRSTPCCRPTLSNSDRKDAPRAVRSSTGNVVSTSGGRRADESVSCIHACRCA